MAKKKDANKPPEETTGARPEGNEDPRQDVNGEDVDAEELIPADPEDVILPGANGRSPFDDPPPSPTVDPRDVAGSAKHPGGRGAGAAAVAPMPGREGMPVQPRFRIKGARTEWHHLFKGSVAPMLKNQSYQKGKPIIVQAEHIHFFHSIDSRLRPLMRTNVVGGHFHYVKWRVNPQTGLPEIYHVSPPVKVSKKQTAIGTKTKEIPVQFEDVLNDRVIVDDHTHSFNYLHSEPLSEEKIKALQADNRARVVKEAQERALASVSTEPTTDGQEGAEA